MLAIHCDKCGKVLLLEDRSSISKQMNEAGWYKLCSYGDYDSRETDIDLCKECHDELQAAVRKEVE